MIARAVIALLIGLAPAASSAWVEPPRGSQLRRDLMDAIRMPVERELGAPVEFVVRTLRIAGDVGFASLAPQRPGAYPIRFEDTPLAASGVAAETIDGFQVHALYRAEADEWRVAEYSIGATDIWWSAPEICATWRAVLPDACG